MNGYHFNIWIRGGAKGQKGISYIWNNMLKNYNWMMIFLKWKVGKRQMIEIGLDAINGIMRNHSLLIDIILSLDNRDIKYIYQISKDHNNLFFIKN